MRPTTTQQAKRRPGRPPKAEAQDTKAALVQAAILLFARHGYAGTSIRAIAREVGCSESVLYAHFEDKRSVFDAVLARYGPQASSSPSHPDPALVESDPPRFLRDLVTVHLQDWDSEEARLLITVLTREGLIYSGAVRDALATMRASVSELFEHWIQAGRIPTHVGTAEQLAFSFTAPIGLTRLLHLHAEADPEERATACETALHHVDVFTRAVFQDNSPHTR